MEVNPPLVLVVDDDINIRKITRLALQSVPYQVIEAENGEVALNLIFAHPPDAVLLDFNLPDMTGLDVIRRLREPLPPIVIFSAGAQRSDIRTAIEAGAVDFLSKPYVTEELIHRVDSAIHSGIEINVGSPYVSRELDVDLDRGRIRIGDRELVLTSVEFDLLVSLVRNSGRLRTYRYLIRELAKTGDVVNETELMQLMNQLRHKLEVDPLQPRHISAEFGIGYRFQIVESQTLAVSNRPPIK